MLLDKLLPQKIFQPFPFPNLHPFFLCKEKAIKEAK